jgi:hypothetical protein
MNQFCCGNRTVDGSNLECLMSVGHEGPHRMDELEWDHGFDPRWLEPCPWCGVVPVVFSSAGGGSPYFSIQCENRNCPMVSVLTPPCGTEQEVIDLWNNRKAT